MKATSDIQKCKLTTELPPELYEAIGRVIVIYSSIEQETRHLIYAILRLSNAEGRLVITEPSTETNIRNINLLLKMHNIAVPQDITELAKAIKPLTEIRNWLAHGVWTEVNGAFYLQITSEDWTPPGQNKKIKRKIIPSIHLVTHMQLQELALVGLELYGSLLDVHKAIHAQQDSLI